MPRSLTANLRRSHHGWSTSCSHFQIHQFIVTQRRRPPDFCQIPIFRSDSKNERVLFCCRRRWAEQHGVVDDETKFRLDLAHVALLPNVRVLCLQAKTLQRAFCRTVLYPEVQFIPIGDRKVSAGVNGVPAMRVPRPRAKSEKADSAKLVSDAAANGLFIGVIE
jgi:hypothetical protein